MERFGYGSLAKMRRESAEILYLLECESYGDKRDQEEEIERMKEEAEAQSRRKY